MEKLYRQVKVKDRNPSQSDWYDTNAGNLYWHNNPSDRKNPEWSCREEYISEEYPQFWYEPIEQPEPVPSDTDIENASTDYLDELDVKDLLSPLKQRIRAAYQKGAKDFRDKNIYISPK